MRARGGGGSDTSKPTESCPHRPAGTNGQVYPCFAEVKRAVGETAAPFGGLHVVFANAGLNGVSAPVDELQPQEWDHTLDINLKGTFLTVH